MAIEYEETTAQSGVEVNSPEPLQPSVKRKNDLDELEVDLEAPEPPSKRARRAVKKGKPLPPKPNSDDEKDGAVTERKEKKEKQRSEHGVWIGNLPFTVTPAILRQWLVNNSGGVILDDAMTRIKLPTVKEPGKDKKEKSANRGFAYVDFADVGSKVAAIALSESDMGARKLLIKDSTSFEGRPKKETGDVGDGEEDQGHAKAERKRDTDASRKIFVGNMSFKTGEEDLRRNFERCGEIEWVKVATFEDTGKCKGYGWVKFKEPEAAAWAVKGFVKIKEQVETEDDFHAENSNSEDGEDGEPGQNNQRQFKTRKWWVNRLMGRELKLELAEDDQVRYKKRYGKDAKQRSENGKPFKARPNAPHQDLQEKENAVEASVEKPLKTQTDLRVARLTGAAVKHTGTKITFD